MRHLVARFVEDAEISGRDQLDALSRLDDAALVKGQRRMFGQRLADGDEGRRLREPVHLGDVPPQLAFHALNRGSGRRRAGRHDTDPFRRGIPHIIGGIRQRNQHGRRRTQRRDAFGGDQAERLDWIDLSQADVHGTDGSHDPHVGPAVGVEHRKRPEVAIRRRHRQMYQCADNVHVSVAVRDHHALWARGRSARVVDGQQVAFADVHRLETRRGGIDERTVVQPPRPRSFERDEVLHMAQFRRTLSTASK